MTDPIEPIRRETLAETNAQPGSREALEAQYGQVWDAAELAADFDVLGIEGPVVVVRCRSDAKKGSMEFQNEPRFYFNWKPASPRFYFG